MRKDFMHRDKWFEVWKSKAPDWPDDFHVTHVPSKILEHSNFYFYIQEEDKLYVITRENLLLHKKPYHKSDHISKQHLTEIPIDKAWREQITNYKRSAT